MKTQALPAHPDKTSPASAAVRILMQSDTGGMIHSTLRPYQITKAVCHVSVNEFWFILSGEGEIWRKEGSYEEITTLTAGITVDIAKGTHFQYRNTGSETFKFICVTMPPWSGHQESSYVKGYWQPTK
ncbi:MAG: cupin domain-containing protein [Deinococcota bacterium]